MTTFAITTFPSLCAALGLLTFVWPSGLGVRGKAIWTMILLLGASKFVVFEALGGNRFSPELPEKLIWALNFVNSVLYVLVALSLVWWTRRGRRVVLPALAVVLAAWGQWEGTRVPPVKEVTLMCPNLPAELDGYRILHLSDVHWSWRRLCVSCAGRRCRTPSCAATTCMRPAPAGRAARRARIDTRVRRACRVGGCGRVSVVRGKWYNAPHVKHPKRNRNRT